MKRILTITIFSVLMIGMWLPSETAAQYRQYRTYQTRTYQTRSERYSRSRDRDRWRSRRYRDTNGHRNYGQYRRTQVGNRRWRMQRQYYYRLGRRLNRMVRIYFGSPVQDCQRCVCDTSKLHFLGPRKRDDWRFFR
jgi:hypothetical protein